MIADLEVRFGRPYNSSPRFPSPPPIKYVGVRNVSEDQDVVFSWPARGTGEHLRLAPGCDWTPIYGASLARVNIWTEPTRLQGLDDGLGGW